ncbi:MAG: DUF362 domain-containing protein [Planctomycetota bacterium]
MSKVYFLPARSGDHSTPPADSAQADMAAGLGRLWDAAGLSGCFGVPDLTALKLHVGEPGTKRTFVSPKIVAELVRLVAATDARPFLTDTAVLYKSPRDNGAGHARVAMKHGYGLEATGAPFVPADGLIGDEDREIPVSGKHFETVAIASAIAHARSMLVLSHATGHLGTGFGGAIKNLGMGCCSKRAKLRQHHGHSPRIDPESCRACGVCAEWCPSDAIAMENSAVMDSAVIDETRCIGCGECIAACLEGAVEFDWSQAGESLSERIAEHAVGAMSGKPGKVAFVTVAMDITKDCDCIGEAQDPVAPDVGILAGTDPVAIDLAVLDLVAARAGRPLEALAYANREPGYQVAYAASLGLGSLDYELVEV